MQAVERLDAIDHRRGQLTGVLRQELRRPRLQQARQRVGPQPPPCRRAGVERGAVGGDRERRARHREHGESHQVPQAVAGMTGQRIGQQHRSAPGLAHRHCRAQQAE